jgi:hypothetical protein
MVPKNVYFKPKLILLAGTIAVSLMLLFPPYVYFDSETSGQKSAGYHFFLKPPQPKPAKEVFGYARLPHMASVRLNDLRLGIQLLIAIPTILGAAILSRPRYSVLSLSMGIFLVGPGVIAVLFVSWRVLSLSLSRYFP